jgi:hypothetical protein
LRQNEQAGVLIVAIRARGIVFGVAVRRFGAERGSTRKGRDHHVLR